MILRHQALPGGAGAATTGSVSLGTTSRAAASTTARTAVRAALLPFSAGVVFAVGLGLGGMTQPASVLAFLDVAGAWDPSLAFVMGGAVGTYLLLLRLARWRATRRAGRPAIAPQGAAAALPAEGREPLADRRLLAGSALFGIGWGLVGLCPGPALVGTVTVLPGALGFVAAMIGGMLAYRHLPTLWLRLRGASAQLAVSAPPQECGPAAASRAA